VRGRGANATAGGTLALQEQAPLVAALVDLDSPDFDLPALSVGFPSVFAVEVFGAAVSFQNPEDRVAKFLSDEMGAGCGDQREAEALVPVVGVDIERGEFSVAEKIRITRRHSGSESVDRRSRQGDNRVRLERVDVSKVISLCAIFGAKLREVVVRHEATVCGLPGADVQTRDRESIGGLGGAKEHTRW